jgi:hypothetical protein
MEEGACVQLKTWTNGVDTVIAADLTDVKGVIETHYGLDDWSQEGWGADDWGLVPEDEVITIHNFTGHEDVVEKTAAEFVRSEGRCFLCSTEW